jgi:hypothetical protein
LNTIIKLRCIDQVLTFESTPLVASGGLEEDRLEVSFCSKWDGMTKTAVFWRTEDEVYRVVLDDEDGCTIPREVLTDQGVIYFGLFGINADGLRRTTQVMRYNVAKGAITDGTQPSDPTPELWDQVLAKCQAMVERQANFEKNLSDRQDELEKSTIGGYYTPTVRQVDEDTLEASFTGSKPDMAPVAPEQIKLPSGRDGVGVAAIVYDGPPNPREIYVDYYATNLSQGVSYKVTVDVMGRLELLSGGATGKVSISLVPRNADNAVVGSPVQGPSVLPDVSGWKKLEWTVTIPSGVPKPVFRVGFYNALGTVYVDNLTITQLTSPSGAVQLIDPSFEAGLVPAQKTGGWTFDDWNINFVSRSSDAASNGTKSAKLQYGLTTQWKIIYTDGSEHPITAPAFPDVSGYMPISGGVFTGAVYVKNGATTSAQLRNTALVSSETNPTVNGQINWKYE